MKNIMPPINTPDNAFHDGNPATGEQGTIVPGLWLNNSQDATRNIQQELISVLTAAGIGIDGNKNNQLLTSIVQLIENNTPEIPNASLLTKGIVQLNSSTTSASEVLAATPKAVKTVNDAALQKSANLSDLANVQTTLENLGLGEGSALPVGTPIPYPSAIPPTGWLKCNGAAFTASQYPKLALVYPALRLPDLRGEFIRGWDDGRNTDTGRVVGTLQGATMLRTAVMEYYSADISGTDGASGIGFANEDSLLLFMPNGAKDPTGSLQPTSGVLNDNAIIGKTSTSWIVEGSRWISIRPRNIAFNYIVRAV